MRFDELTAYLEKLEATTSRLEMFKLLGELFKKAGEEEVAEIAYLCEARLLPAFTGVQINIGERMTEAAIAEATNKTQQQINKLYKDKGDLGVVIHGLLPKERRSRLSVSEVYETLLEIARVSGAGSIETKVRLLADLLKKASAREARYIVRFVLGRLRLGVGAPTIIEAVARTSDDGKQARAIIERAYNLCSDLGLVLKTMKERGLEALKRFKVHVGNPVRMMMAERLSDAEAIVKRLGRSSVEAKIDGFRCQIHVNSRRVEIFSRNLERMTEMFPDIVAGVREHLAAKNAIIEGEAIAVNEATGEFYPFQVTVQRKRKHRVEEMAKEFPLAFVAFDLLYLDGKDYTGLVYSERRERLEKIVKKGGNIRVVEREVIGNAEKLQRFFDDQIERGLEGIIAKRLDSTYAAGARNFNWIKLKRAYRGELSDTVDLVVIGYLRGRGMRAKLGIGALLAAVYDPRTDTFKSVAKVGSGLSEENWIKIRKMLDKIKLSRRPARVDSQLEPDVWTEPRHVITVLADEITRSPIHTTARDGQGTGLALRFPRMVGFIRDDKSPEDATTTDEIKEMFGMQKKKKG